MDLKEFFSEQHRVALAFSGGVDSAYLLYAALECGAQVRAYFVKSAFQPQFELDDATRLAALLKADMTVISADVLSCPSITGNLPERCYHCKKLLFGLIADRAALDGYTTLIDGTNASDDAGDRPGMRALKELGVRSPLRECGITKAEIRGRSREAGLFSWNKPAYACLATRIMIGEDITNEKLRRAERAEEYLLELGFSNFRVRSREDCAKIQLPSTQFPLLLEKREQLLIKLKEMYSAVTLDLEARDE